jgi:hypothetical protein
MTLTVTEDRMILHADGLALAGATRRLDGKWDVSTWPVPLGRDQAITALTITELLARGYPVRPPSRHRAPERTDVTKTPDGRRWWHGGRLEHAKHTRSD